MSEFPPDLGADLNTRSIPIIRATEPTPRGQVIVLTGPMGAGKSTIAAELAQRLGWQLIDTDELIVTSHGEIPEIFVERGEDYFRNLEAATINRALDGAANAVISLGGGAVLAEDTRKRIGQLDTVFLSVNEDIALERIGGGANRPVLAGNPQENWRRIFQQRLPLYRQTSTLEIDTSDKDVAAVTEEIIQHFQLA
ncbi:shikimate kinase [Micrococcoides hystricis]|uniref:Shikimate kinase n=1 Tax=Micrococcoides hystricis TaxID=1572761 RepID=A0ABV6P7H5_9MICC